ncbi:ArnT family glycosyltransferase [Verrucomicrobiota bacterium]
MSLVFFALYLRSAGLFRDVNSGHMLHPDEPKQFAALHHYLDGDYVWYTDSWFYDGYPYALNHVDEWILRPFLIFKALVKQHLFSSVECVPETESINLIYAARALRVLYGMLCLCLMGLIAQRFFKRKEIKFWSVFLFAISPIAIAVTHYAVGDIGTDLFSALMILCLCLYVEKSKSTWMFLAGAATGASFACKYNGALAGFAIGVFILLEFIANKDPKYLLRNLSCAVGGFFLGAMVFTPACFINFKKTWQDVFINFRMIQEYDAPANYAEISCMQRVSGNALNNLPRICRFLGFGLIFAAVSGVILSARRFFSSESVRGNKTETLKLAVFSSAIIALMVSIVGKPSVQPFHFSYIQIPLILSAAYFFGSLLNKKHFIWRGISVFLLFAITAELAVKTRQENFFWKRSDNACFSKEMEDVVFYEKHGSADIVKRVFLEPENPAVFRNLARTIEVSNADFWNNIHIAPMPTVPYPVDSDWIFANGPVFPRNDRMFYVRGGAQENKQIVLYEQPGEINVGLRSGRWPARVKLELGGSSREVVLAPSSQDILALEPRTWREINSRNEFSENAFIVPVNVKSSVGDVWVTVLVGNREVSHFIMFGGETGGVVSFNFNELSRPEIEQELARTRFLENNDISNVVLEADDAGRQAYSLLEESIPLPCGAYLLECEFMSLTPDFDAALGVERLTGFEYIAVEETKLSAECKVMKFRFSKTFAPYQCRIKLKAVSGHAKLRSWRLMPDASAILDDLERWKDREEAPEWAKRAVTRSQESGARSQELENRKIVFGKSIELGEVKLSEQLAGEAWELCCGMKLKEFSLRNFDVYQVFVHLRDNNGKQVHSDGFPLWKAFISSEFRMPVVLKKLPDTLSGIYDVEVGVWNVRTRKRLSVSGDNLSSREKRKRLVNIGKVMIKP